VPIDVGKHEAMSLVCDFWGEVIVAPFTFRLDEGGVARLTAAVAGAARARDACWARIGVEQAGHYHQNLVAALGARGHQVVALNPAQVKQNRAQDLLRSLKTDQRDLGAMAELIVRGKGRPAEPLARPWPCRPPWPPTGPAR
jgi:transposase